MIKLKAYRWFCVMFRGFRSFKKESSHILMNGPAGSTAENMLDKGWVEEWPHLPIREA